MLIALSNAEVRFGDNSIFSDVNVEVHDGDSIGLVGYNGAGKSTLLNALTKSLPLFSGAVSQKSGLTLGYLTQNASYVSQNTVYQEMLTVFDDELRLLENIKQITKDIANCPHDSTDYRTLTDRYNRMLDRANAMDAYNVEVKVKTVLNGMGMMPFSQQVVDNLSGGEKTKVALCKLLLRRPELMILDEPTNHLDYKTIDWLENFLSDKKSALIIVSHDRYFLDRVCNRIWEVDNGKVYTYNGNYGAYKVQKKQREDLEQKQYERQQKEIEKLTDYVAKNKVRASTANMAKSREKQLEKMEVLDAPQTQRRPPRFNFVSTMQPTKEVLNVKKLTVAFGDRKVLDQASLLVGRSQKVALIGLNGTGKSTLLKTVNNGNAYPSNVVFGKNVTMGYYDQENLNLNANLSVLDQLWFDNTRMSQTEVRNLLAQVTLTGEAVFKKVGQLSGGERAKLGLAVLMAKDNNFLLLDEPTNHLDLPSREALEQSLKNYEGTLLFVSHDRYFVNAVADVVVELEEGKLTAYNGNYDNFIAEKKKQMEQQAVVIPVAKPTSQPTSNYRSAKQRAEETNRKNKIKQLEKQMTELEEKQAQLQEQMALPQIVSDYSKLSVVMEELKQVEATYEQICLEWEQLID